MSRSFRGAVGDHIDVATEQGFELLQPIGLPKIPTLASGGVVEPVSGGVLALLAEIRQARGGSPRCAWTG